MSLIIQNLKKKKKNSFFCGQNETEFADFFVPIHIVLGLT